MSNLLEKLLKSYLEAEFNREKLIDELKENIKILEKEGEQEELIQKERAVLDLEDMEIGFLSRRQDFKVIDLQAFNELREYNFAKEHVSMEKYIYLVNRVKELIKKGVLKKIDNELV